MRLKLYRASDMATAMTLVRRDLGAGNRTRVEARFDQAAMFAAWLDLYSGR